MADDLYDQDFYLWTQAQAAALRAQGRAPDELDYDHLAEELEDLGSSQRQRVEGLVRQIIVHLYKLAASQNPEPINHWRAEVVEFRIRLKRPLTRSIRNALQEELEDVHQEALTLARLKMANHEPTASVDPSLRWSLLQILGEVDDPLPPRREA